MFDDELDDDASSAGGPIHPDDRLWRHPSEVAAAASLSTRRSPSPGRIWAVAVLAGLTGAAVALTTMALTGQFSPTVVERQSAISPVSVTIAQARAPLSTRRIVKDTAAVMAGISVVAEGRSRHGSALVLRSDGSLLTSEALVRGVGEVTVTLADGRVLPGTVRGTDPSTGLAVVQVAATGLRVATIDGSAVQPGDAGTVVTGAASPTEAPWVTSGVVSSLDGRATSGSRTLAGLIETSSPLPASADGGALVAADGKVTGLCVAVSGAEPGAGYAVPIGIAGVVADDLIAYGEARKAWLGIEGDDLTGARAAELHLLGGAVLATVTSGSPAAAAGLEVGDVVTAVADRPVHSMGELIAMLPLHRPTEQVELTLYRGTTRMVVPVVLGEHP